MATTKTTKNPVKKIKEAAAKSTAKNKKATPKNLPSEEQIRRKAEEIYYQRLHKGEYGTALDDWQKAEKILAEG